MHSWGNRFWESRIPPTLAAGGPTFIRFSTLTGISESGSGGSGWIYTGTATDGNGGGSDYTIAAGVAGGFQVTPTEGGSIPVFGMYTTSAGAWDANYYCIAFPSGNWVVNTAGFTDIVTNVRTVIAGDIVRFVFDTTNTFVVELARAAAPTTWLPMATGTVTRSGTLHPHVHSFSAAGAVFTAPQVP